MSVFLQRVRGPPGGKNEGENKKVLSRLVSKGLVNKLKRGWGGGGSRSRGPDRDTQPGGLAAAFEEEDEV